MGTQFLFLRAFLEVACPGGTRIGCMERRVNLRELIVSGKSPARLCQLERSIRRSLLQFDQDSRGTP